MTEHDAAERRIREKLATGSLPREEPTKTWIGPSFGQPCQGCDSLIELAQMEVELDFRDGTTVRMHRDCMHVWDDVRRP